MQTTTSQLDQDAGGDAFSAASFAFSVSSFAPAPAPDIAANISIAFVNLASTASLLAAASSASRRLLELDVTKKIGSMVVRQAIDEDEQDPYLDDAVVNS